MNLQIDELILPSSKYSIKCPYSMINPGYITIHETSNDASAMAEASFMQGNNNKISFHAAIDHNRAVVCLPLDRSSWNAGDGVSGTGNRNSISLEICYSKSGGDRYEQAWINTAYLTALLLKEYKLTIDKVKKHQDWSGKYCPHRTLDNKKWDKFKAQVSAFLLEMEANKMAEFKKGYQKITYAGQVVHAYKQNDDITYNKKKYKLEVGLLSTPNYKQLQTINTIDDEKLYWCKVNCSYFVMDGSEKGQVLGREQSFTVNETPFQKEWLEVIVLNNNDVICGSQLYGYNRQDIKLAYSPACIILNNGKKVFDISSGAKAFSLTKKYNQSIHAIDYNGVHHFIVTEGLLDAYQCQQMCLDYGMRYAFMLDSGGSAQMKADGSLKRNTGRAIPNVLCFYGVELKNEVTPTPDPTPTSGPKHKVGDIVKITKYSASSTSTSYVTKTVTAKITKVLSTGVLNPYLLDSGNYGWTNDNFIVEDSTPAVNTYPIKVMKATNELCGTLNDLGFAYEKL